MRLRERSYLLPLLSGVLAMILLRLVDGTSLELMTLDWRFRLRPAPAARSPVTMVLLRAQRVGAATRVLREELADLLDDVARLPEPTRPRAVVLDATLTLADQIDAGAVGPGERLIAEGAALGNVVQGFEVVFRAEEGRDPGRDLSMLAPHLLDAEKAWPPARAAIGFQLAHSAIAGRLYATAARAGFTNLTPPSEGLYGATLHTIPLFAPLLPDRALDVAPSLRVPVSLSLAAASLELCGARPLQSCIVPDPDGLKVDGKVARRIPLDRETGLFWINYRRRFASCDATGTAEAAHGGCAETELAGAPGEAPAAEAWVPEVVLFHGCGPAAAGRLEAYGDDAPGVADERITTNCHPGEPGVLTSLDGRRRIAWERLAGQMLLAVDAQEPSPVSSPLGPSHHQATAHAQTIANLLEGDFLRVPSRLVPWLSGGMLLVLAMALRRLARVESRGGWRALEPLLRRAPRGTGRWILIGATVLFTPELVLVIAWGGVAVLVFVGWSYWLPVILPVGALCASLVTYAGTLPGRVRALSRDIGELRRKRTRLLEELAEKAAQLEVARNRAEEAAEVEREAGSVALEAAPVEREPGSVALEAAVVEREPGSVAPEAAVVEPEPGSVALEAATVEREPGSVALEAATVVRVPARVASELAEVLAPAAGPTSDTTDDGERVKLAQEEILELDAELDELHLLLQRHMPHYQLMGYACGGDEASVDLATRLQELQNEIAGLKKKLDANGHELEGAAMRAAGLVAWADARVSAYQRPYQWIRAVLQDVLEDDRRLRVGVSIPLEHSGPDLERLDPIVKETDFITRDPELIKILHTIAERVGPSDGPVLIRGESGCGKELIAKLLHKFSSRSARQLVSINSGAIPDSLQEDELFGHVKGAFTGAVADKEGLFAVADGGTLFIDELGDMPLPLQLKLLRVLENKQYYPVGSSVPRGTNFRLVTATNVDLAAALGARTFRRDLLYRVQLHEVRLKPLRERAGDIALLATCFLSRICEKRHKRLTFSVEGLLALELYPWPGNVRELRHVVEALVDRHAGDDGQETRALTVQQVREQLLPKREEIDLSAEQLFPGEEMRLLELARRHRMNKNEIMKDFHGQRSEVTLDRWLRALFAKALWGTGWSIPRAVSLLAGEKDASLLPLLDSRVREFVGNLDARLRQEERGRLERSLQREYSMRSVHIKRLCEALRYDDVRRY